MRRFWRTILVAMIAALITPVVSGQDGIDLGSGQTLRFTQDTPTGFGNAVGGGQDSAGGSEINQLWGDFDSGTGTLSVSLSGNLEGNFNKMFLFIDGVVGGENILGSTNVDGGFNEINNLAGLTFDSGFTPDHGLRIEVGTGFYGVNAFDLIDDVGISVATGTGPADLPATGVGSSGVLLGWDNSNVLGVDGVSAAGASTATTGFEFEIDMTAILGGPVTQDIGISGFITSGDATFLSNQVIGGIGGAGNLGAPGVVDFNAIAGNQFVTIPATAVPEPGSAMVLSGLLGLVTLRRRRR